MISSSPQNQPLVSVVIPCYNAQQWVDEAIQSCLNQTYALLEIILINDGSSDGTLGVLRDFESRYPAQIRVLSQPQSGAPVARNRGLNICAGDYIQFLDADDILLPRKIESQMQCVQKQMEETKIPPDLVVGNFIMVQRDGQQEPIFAETENNWLALIKIRLGYTSANLWRREMMLQIDGWDESLQNGQDYDLMFRILKMGGDVLYAPEFLTQFRRINDQSIMRRNVDGRLELAIESRKQIHSHLEQIGKYEGELQNQLNQSYFRMIRRMHYFKPERAVALHRELIPRDFIPESSTTSRIYRKVYRLAGFRNAERFMKLRVLAARVLQRSA